MAANSLEETTMRTLALAAMVGLLLTGAALAARVTDGAGSFEITWPKGWKPGTDPAYTEAFGPDYANTGTNCLAERRAVPDLAAMTQQDLNKELSQPLSQDDWQAFIGANLNGIADAKVVKGPVVSQRVTAAMTAENQQVLKVRAALFVRPGELFLAICLTSEAAWPAQAVAIEAILDSFHPL
jgi:hypothetical protein